ncbi:Glycosyltransferase, catalytic subunit of cellulose synthase and poly-beta-1,6-N-acetylglucosamine synthase [Salegentibacter agarivorans]|uniref:Glycosyltransferase, catalytic subunit of cellulose synthase and poly-beta-1,6-N-acetylglucosamine synthase n=1 Tax=Salegentibacter agarivorans TaxID=345907 RepID=A0A1I2L807_9FLAO|nr:glycosyltransferase [Salegentibacter agarivorans]SFF74630.1 Glycosyltransferase, catalytic subunit of cellulose synthase and poly-beta-1,6-N-acetylglucosamine synthase [Salegentibacter agarivorans]
MFIFVIICICYSVLMLMLLYGWKKIPEFSSESSPAEIRFSIIVPFRNETENLPNLLNSLSQINYPESKFEILLVNDESEDNSVEIIEEFQENHSEFGVKLLENKRVSNSPKKNAINTAINSANFEYIITTDADCKIPKNWLKSYNDFILKTGNKLIAGPVALSSLPTANTNIKRKNILRNFEELDVLSLQASTAGAFGIGKAFMCNGANLCYEKDAFLEVSGFTGNDNIASGDDVFLLQKFQQENYKIGFLKSKEVLVYTKPQQSFGNLVSQRIRWASKAPAYKGLFAKFTGVSVLLMNLSLVIALFLVFFQILLYQPILIIFLVKFNLDFILIYSSAKFFQRETVLRSYFWSSIFYPFFSTYVAVKSLFSDFSWKGRQFKN